MARRKYSPQEVLKWMEEHDQNIFYINKNDSNLFVKRRSGLGGTFNLTQPLAWGIIIVFFGLIAMIALHKKIFG
jgi:uncharacterized membrane protein